MNVIESEKYNVITSIIADSGTVKGFRVSTVDGSEIPLKDAKEMLPMIHSVIIEYYKMKEIVKDMDK